jgi:SAM-dependent methyltransferase
VVAVEPVEAMRAILAGAVAGAEVVDGTAEAMPLPDGSADAVTVAQAFHWFSTVEALSEIHRVLRPGGGLALVWNRRDLNAPVQAAVEQIIARHRGDVPTHRSGRWKSAFESTGLFGPLQEHLVPHHQDLDRQMLVDRVMSTSVMAALPDAERHQVVTELEQMAAWQAEPVKIDYTTQVYVCQRR